MGAIDKDRHRPWLAYALEESLEHALLSPRDIVGHANPEVLVTQLPPAVISVLLSRALAIGTFSAAQVLESAPPALLAEHLNPEVMWRCLKDAAERGGVSRKGGTRSAPSRQWFASVLARALECELITPADVLRYLPPSEFVAEATRPVLVDLLKEALARSTFDPELVLQHITPIVIAESLETSLVWECIAAAAARHFELGPSATRSSDSLPNSATMATPPPVASKPVAKSPDKDNTANGELHAASPGEKTPMVTTAGAINATKSHSGPIVARADSLPSRAAASAPSPVPATSTARHDASELTPSADLDARGSRAFPFSTSR